MSAWNLKLHYGLRAGSCLPGLIRETDAVRPIEYAVWITMGVASACASALPDWKLGIPGHAIVRSVFPLAMGLALAPRHGAGCVMSGVGSLTAVLLGSMQLADTRSGMGAITSLALTGPLLDLALRSAKPGWGLYVRIMSAGLATNLVALAVKAAEKQLMPGRGGRSFGAWLTQPLGPIRCSV